MRHNATFKIILTSLFAALICVATMLVQIYIPSTGGYANAGDGIILMCAFLLTPHYAVAAAAIGSFLADILAGYAVYAPGTLVIKGLVALVAALICKRFAGKTDVKSLLLTYLVAAVIAELAMVAGYFLYESLLLGYGMGALGAVPANLCQGAVGTLIALVLTPALRRSNELVEMLNKFKK